MAKDIGGRPPVEARGRKVLHPRERESKRLIDSKHTPVHFGQLSRLSSGKPNPPTPLGASTTRNTTQSPEEHARDAAEIISGAIKHGERVAIPPFSQQQFQDKATVSAAQQHRQPKRDVPLTGHTRPPMPRTAQRSAIFVHATGSDAGDNDAPQRHRDGGEPEPRKSTPLNSIDPRLHHE
ncbi:hypothetical protein [Streptomyces sp. NPDC017991]|uniref:hypothetical protein n=1 Tax=Streptomyces sp. NPDC017991 TaxID=3365026 RepID=UPI0037A06349